MNIPNSNFNVTYFNALVKHRVLDQIQNIYIYIYIYIYIMARQL